MSRDYFVQFEANPGNVVTWIKTAQELLGPNGEEPLICWMLRECEARNLYFHIEVLGENEALLEATG